MICKNLSITGKSLIIICDGAIWCDCMSNLATCMQGVALTYVVYSDLCLRSKSKVNFNILRHQQLSHYYLFDVLGQGQSKIFSQKLQSSLGKTLTMDKDQSTQHIKLAIIIINLSPGVITRKYLISFKEQLLAA